MQPPVAPQQRCPVSLPGRAATPGLAGDNAQKGGSHRALRPSVSQDETVCVGLNTVLYQLLPVLRLAPDIISHRRQLILGHGRNERVSHAFLDPDAQLQGSFRNIAIVDCQARNHRPQ
jgi:hypothetical protein